MDTSAIQGLAQPYVRETTNAAEGQGVVTSDKNELGMDEFFKLLTTQLVSQDPLEPMQDTEFISQMANFSSLSQMEAIAQNTSGLQEEQRAASLMNLIGKQVVAEDGDGGFIEGIVERIEWNDGVATPYVGNVAVPFENILQVSREPNGDPGSGLTDGSGTGDNAADGESSGEALPPPNTGI
jgi:flagellar basal-body rod modification protein FlgD